MNVEIRIYKRFDTDLLALHTSGFSVTRMMNDALVAYATGKPYHVLIGEMAPFELSDKATVRVRLPVTEHVSEVRGVLSSIKKGYRSNFCKQLLRNALVQQNLTCYFDGKGNIPLHEKNADTFAADYLPGVVPASVYRYRRTGWIPGAEEKEKEDKNKNTGIHKKQRNDERSGLPASDVSQLSFGEPVSVNGRLMIPVSTPQGIQLIPVPAPAQEKTLATGTGSPPKDNKIPDKASGTKKPLDTEKPSGNTDANGNITENDDSEAPALAGDDSLMAVFDAI